MKNINYIARLMIIFGLFVQHHTSAMIYPAYVEDTPCAHFVDAVRINSLYRINKALEEGVDINCVDADGNSALHVAGSVEMTKYLIEHGAKASINKPNTTGATPLLMANDPETIKYLLERGANPNVQGFSGQTPLHKAVASNELDSVKHLVQHNAKIDVRSELGDTPLSIAQQRGYKDIADFLIKNEPKSKLHEAQKKESFGDIEFNF